MPGMDSEKAKKAMERSAKIERSNFLNGVEW